MSGFLLDTYPAGGTIYADWHTFDSNGASVTLTGLAVTDIEIYKNGSATQRASDNGYALQDTDGIDFDNITGIHGISIDLSDNSDSGFFAVGSQYKVIVSSVTVDSRTVNFVLGSFRIVAAESSAGVPKVDVSHAAGTAWASGAITASAIAADAITAAKIADGAIDAATFAAGAITASALASDCITDAKVASDVTIASVTGAVGSVTGNVGGNVAGSVGSVTGNVGGNVTGSVGSLASQAKADVNAEVVDCLNVDTYAEPGQGAPAATASIAAKLGHLFKAYRNKKTQTATTFSLFNDAGDTVDQKAGVTDSSGTFTRDEIASGP